MKACRFVARSLADTDRLGRLLAEELPDGTVVALCGTLGAGKTQLVKGLAEACGIPREVVVSPTFVLCQEYQGTRTLFHLDAYRLRNADEFRQLGVDELFRSRALVLIEWADRVVDELPSNRVTIQIEVAADESRTFDIRVTGEPLESFVARLQSRLQGG